MGAYLLRRLAQAVLILLGVSLVTFVLLYLLPADPARQIAGRSATPEVVANIRAQLGLDQPFHEQYLRYLGALLQGDLGRSYLQRTEVATLIMSRLPASLLLMAGAIVCELALGLTMGVAAALRAEHRHRPRADADLLHRRLGAAIRGRHAAALRLRRGSSAWFPLGGYGTFAHLVLPSLTLGLLGAGWYCADDALGDARRAAPGLHAHRPGQGPERLARRAGACAAQRAAADHRHDRHRHRPVHERHRRGRIRLRLARHRPAAWQAIQRVDIPIIMGVTLVSAVAIVLGNLLADLVAPFIDPRIKLR